MANFNNFPATYQTPYPTNGTSVGGINFAPQPYQMGQIQPQQPQIQQQQPVYQQSGLIWVKGISEVNAYQLQPGSTVALWDTDEQVVYIKSADQTGRPSVTILDYIDRNAKSDNGQMENYATTEQINTLQNQINEIVQRLDAMKSKQNNRRDVNHNGKSSV